MSENSKIVPKKVKPNLKLFKGSKPDADCEIEEFHDRFRSLRADFRDELELYILEGQFGPEEALTIFAKVTGFPPDKARQFLRLSSSEFSKFKFL